MLHELRYYSRMAIGICKMLHARLPSDPKALLRRQFKTREGSFLDTVRRVVFERADHPYTWMFRAAGCEYSDLVDSVKRIGLEPTLAKLRSEGVYLAHDEWKGKIPFVRAGRHPQRFESVEHQRPAPSHGRSYYQDYYHFASSPDCTPIFVLKGW